MSQFKTGRGRCPANGSKRWSYIGPDHRPDFIISYGSPTHEPVSGWVFTGENDLGGQMFALADESAAYNKTNADLISLKPGQLSKDADTQPEPIAPEIKHRVYEELLARCPLSAAHRSHLLRRKLPYHELCRLLPFGSLPHPTKRPKLAKEICEALDLPLEDLLRVPGFFINNNNNVSIAGATGLLVPALDTKGRLQAFQIRKDQIKKDQSRYTWMSSGNKGGVGSGAPGSFFGDRHSERVAFTEGSIKGAALMTEEWFDATITVPGVGNTQSALALLDQLPKVKEAIVLFDNDWQTKPAVLKGMARLIEALLARGIAVQALSWDDSWGKGIDDAIVNGLQRSDLLPLPTDGIIRAAQKVTYANPRLESENLLPIWNPGAAKEPTVAALREETARVVFDALRKPAGTFSSVAANTGSGKTYAVLHTSPTQTLQMYRNYGALEEAERELRQVYGHGMVRVLYGRIAPPTNPKDTRAQKRFERAGCPEFAAMKARAERGHSPCQGCPLAPKVGALKDSDDQSICAYWRQRFKTIEKQPAYLLAVPQSIAANPDLLSLLPKEETRELFGEYGRLVIDDCPEFIQHLTRESSISFDDIKQWSEHPGLRSSSRSLDEPKGVSEIKLLQDWTANLLKWFQAGSLGLEELKSMRESSAKVMALEEIICEEPTGRAGELLPLRAARSLAGWLAKGGGVRFGEKERDGIPKGTTERRLYYLRPASELLERLSLMTVCHLDATPDESTLAWFANLTGMKFEAHEMKRRFPPIIQIPDILWDRDQVKEQKALIRALTEHIHDQGGIVLGFKNREGEEEDHLAQDGHWGYSERGFNCFSGVESMALIGHFALPTGELNRVAWQMRELSKVMEKPFPDAFVKGTFESKRTYSDPWRPFVREMHVCDDRLVEHMRRHRHTSAVLQGANRPRNFGAPVYLLSGEPLDGLPWDVPVKIWTRQELIQNLGLELGPSEVQLGANMVNVALQATNKKRQEEAKERFHSLMLSARAYMKELGKLPGVRELRRFLAFGKGMVVQKLAYLVRDRLVEELALEAGGRDFEGTETTLKRADQRIAESVGREWREGDLKAIEWGVPNTHLNTINSLRPLFGTPHSISKNGLETHDIEGESGSVGQVLARYQVCEPKSGPQSGETLCEPGRGVGGVGERVGSERTKPCAIEPMPRSGVVESERFASESIERESIERESIESESVGEAGIVWGGGVPPLERKNLLPISRYPLNRDDVQALGKISAEAKEDIFTLYDDLALGYGWTSIYELVRQSFGISVEAFCSLIWNKYGITKEYMQPLLT